MQLAAVLGGTNQQIENAAAIGMEHHLPNLRSDLGLFNFPAWSATQWAR
jgi:L-serine deaminase